MLNWLHRLAKYVFPFKDSKNTDMPGLRHHISDIPMSLIFEATPSAMIMVQANGHIALVNRQAERLFGFDRDELIDQSIEKLIPDRFRASHPEQRDAYFAAPEPRSMGSGRDLFGLTKDGCEIPIEIGLNPFEISGQLYTIAAIIDISERRQLQERFRLAVEAAPNAMIMVNQSGHIELINKQTENLFGYLRKELIGESVDILVPDAVRADHPKLFASFFEEPRARAMGSNRDLMGRRKDGTEIPVEIGLNPIETPDGILVMASVVDISERRRAEEQLHALHENLENTVAERTAELQSEREALARSNEDLAAFAYIASHDLKSPLRHIESLIGWIEQDLEGSLEAQTRKYMTLVKSRMRRLTSLLEDLLTYSRVGREREETCRVDLKAMIENIVTLYQGTDKTMNVQVPDDLPIINTHRAALELVFRNLIGNAIKHHDRDKINLTIAFTRDESFVTFSVNDDGPGIPTTFHDRVFGMFKTLKSRDRVEGSGMGLAIVKRMIESRKGQIDVESKDGQRGTTFSFEWPVNEQE